MDMFAFMPQINPALIRERKLSIGARYLGPVAVTIKDVMFAGLLFKSGDGHFLLFGEVDEADDERSTVRFIQLSGSEPLNPVYLPSVEIAPPDITPPQRTLGF